MGKVGIGAHGDRAFARIKSVEPRMVGGGQRNELLQADTALQYALGEEQRQPRISSPGTPLAISLKVVLSPLGILPFSLN